MMIHNLSGEPEFKDAKQVFLLLAASDQMAAMYEMLAYFRGQMASIQKQQIDFSAELKDFENELREVRRMREEREARNGDRLLDTTEKIAKALAGRFDGWVYFRDKILPALLIIISIYLLRGAFGK